MKKKVLIILMISIVFGFATGYSLHHLIHFNQKQEEMVLLPEHPFYLLDEVNEEVLYNTLKHYDFPNPAIITAQAVLESGNFKSKLCRIITICSGCITPEQCLTSSSIVG